MRHEGIFGRVWICRVWVHGAVWRKKKGWRVFFFVFLLFILLPNSTFKKELTLARQHWTGFSFLPTEAFLLYRFFFVRSLSLPPPCSCIYEKEGIKFMFAAAIQMRIIMKTETANTYTHTYDCWTHCEINNLKSLFISPIIPIKKTQTRPRQTSTVQLNFLSSKKNAIYHSRRP